MKRRRVKDFHPARENGLCAKKSATGAEKINSLDLDRRGMKFLRRSKIPTAHPFFFTRMQNWTDRKKV